MTRIKICGITSLDDALDAARAGADAIGLIFADSPRRVEPEIARRIVVGLPPLVKTVGVFMDAPRDEILELLERTGIELLQFHGSESPEYCCEFPRPVLKRFAVSEEDTAETLAARVEGYNVAASLIDPGAGNGRSFRWETARDLPEPCFIAGGLNAQNVSRAIQASRPYGVDASSGLEVTPGKKSREKMAAFVQAVRETDAHAITG